MEVLNLNSLKDEVSQRKIFFGEYSGFQRFDVYKYPFAKSIEESMRNAFWNPSEISLVSDRLNFPKLPEHIQEILTLNLLFQTLMDSAQSRGLEMVLASITTSPEWEAVFRTQAYFEQIHSLSYSHILREVFPNATEVFDRIGNIPEIKQRLTKEIESYNNTLEGYTKKDVVELLLRMFFLEGLKFYVSFLITYSINTSFNNYIQGITKIIKLINFDEDKHVSVVSGLLSILKSNKDEGFSDIIDSDWYIETATEICREVVWDEYSWGKFLLSHGDIPGLNQSILHNFTSWWGNERLKRLNLKTELPFVEKIDTIDWFNMYRDINLENTAQQEAEGLAYKIGILKDDIPEGKLNV